MSNRKSTVPPPRPPAPKMGGGSGGISFSFKALEEEDDDDELIVFTGKFEKQVHEEKERHSRDMEKERSMSKSPERGRQSAEHIVEKSPSIRSQNSFEKLKGKLQDTITKKMDEFSSDSQIRSSNDREPSEHGDFVSEQSATGNIEIDHSNTSTKEQDSVAEFYDIEDKLHESVYESGQIEQDTEEIDINEEYYSPDAEDFSELPGVVSNVRQRKRFQKLRKIKPKFPPAPVTMSKLHENLPEVPSIDTKTAQNSKDRLTSEKLKETESVLHLSGVKIPVKKLVGCIMIVFLYMVMPLPSYISGMMFGVILSSGCWMLYIWVTEPPKPKEPIPEDPPLDKLPPLPVPEMKEPKGEDGHYKGWLNELMEYNPEKYSINQTHSVYIHLEGTALRLRRPKVNVPKRAMWDEPSPTPQFIHQRHFDIESSKVLLLPSGLVRKRIWSKKYPICIELAKDGSKHSVSHESLASNAGIQNNNSVNQSGGGISNSSSVDSTFGFELVNEQKCDRTVLYLFARTCHEKEQWYKRFVAASKGVPLKNHILEIRRILNSSPRHRRSSSSDSLRCKRQESSDSLSSLGTNSPTLEDDPAVEYDLTNFVMYMSRLMPREKDSLPSSPAHMGTFKDRPENRSADSKMNVPVPTAGPRGIVCDPTLWPLNALLGRCFWDFLRDQYWMQTVREKLQRKLSKIHIPYFIEELKISDIDLGTEIPVIRRANKPFLDENGFWVDLDVTYSGKFKMTIETKVNLLKLKQSSTATSSAEKPSSNKSAVTHSDEEDSAESSTDEEEETGTVTEEGNAQPGGTGRKLMKYIHKITASKYFQTATENKYIKKAMTGVSNTPLILTVEVQKLNGNLAINVPAPPSDRFWYGFRGNPQLWLVAKPKVGEREVTMSHITEWIEKKLAVEFQHVLVMPNMDDLVIPILRPGNATDPSTLPHSCSESEL